MADRFDFDELIHRPQIVGKVSRAGLSQQAFRAQDLSIQVGRDHVSSVSDDNTPNTAHGQHQHCGATYSTDSRDQGRRRLESLLRCNRQDTRPHLSVVSLQLGGSEFGKRNASVLLT